MQVTQQCNQLRKGSHRLVPGAVVLPRLCLPLGSLGPDRKRPARICSDPTLCFSSVPRDTFGP